MVRERHGSYEDAKRRVEKFPADGLVGLPLIFQELPDGSQRLVREDGKPLQWHRVPEEEDWQRGDEQPLPLTEEPFNLGRPIFREPADEDEPPLPLVE